MVTERLDILAAAAGGTLLSGNPGTLVAGLFTDTRAPLRGGLFVALRGERFDGSRFARTAVEHGAVAVMLDQPDAAQELPDGTGIILVDDTRKGYLAIAAAHRRKLSAVRWFGVTGSVGKSTTKEMLAHILQEGAGWHVHKNAGNFNNAVGLPHTILGVSPAHDAAVLELGANHPGEIRELAAVARPHVAIITCAAPSHLDAFGSVENIAREKGGILSFQDARDTSVLPADSPHLALWRGTTKGKVITFGAGRDADVCSKQRRVNHAGCAQFVVCHGADAVACVLRVPGLHQASNTLAAIAAALAAGVPLDRAVEAANTFEGMARRFSVTFVRGFTLIDDAYNANPASFAAALETLKALQAERKYVVAGDMLELGPTAEEYHHELGRQLADCGLSGLITVGKLARAAGTTASRHGLPAALWAHCATPEEAATALRPRLSAGDAVLVKGSHGVNLDKCCEMLLTTT